MNVRSAQVSSERPFYARYAEAYDLLVTDPVEPWVVAVHDRLAPSAAVLDAGCGTGRHAAGLIARGHRVDLVDASPELLSLAVRRCPASRAVRADLCTMTARPEYDAVTCRGVLNDMVTDGERTSAVASLAAHLRPGGQLFLDVRERDASQERIDGAVRTKQVTLPDGAQLTFTARTTWDGGLMRVEESYLVAGQPPAAYHFVMRPWTGPELRTALHAAGLHRVDIRPGVGRRTADRLFVVAS